MNKIYMITETNGNSICGVIAEKYKKDAIDIFIKKASDIYLRNFSSFDDVVKFRELNIGEDSGYHMHVHYSEVSVDFEICLSEDDYEGYPYEIDDEKVNLYDAQKILHDRYPDENFIEMDELSFSQIIYDIQRGELNIDGGKIDGLLERFYLTYRGGEIEETVYAENEKEALKMVCAWNHHPEYWEVSE